jgi:hypothetical protein
MNNSYGLWMALRVKIREVNNQEVNNHRVHREPQRRFIKEKKKALRPSVISVVKKMAHSSK